MTVLGGGLGGEVVLTGGKGFGLNMRLEAARVDMNRLLPPKEQIQGDSLIDGTLNASAGEACDDGNTVDGDGCQSDCLTAGAAEGGARVGA